MAKNSKFAGSDAKWSGDEWSELGLEDLDAIAGGANEGRVRYHIEGYSAKRKGDIFVSFATYEQALQFCHKYEVDTACISERVCPY
jgi:hypothetical protein